MRAEDLFSWLSLSLDAISGIILISSETSYDSFEKLASTNLPGEPTWGKP